MPKFLFTNPTCDSLSSFVFVLLVDSSSAWIHHIGQKFHDVLQVKATHHPDIQAVESSGILKLLDVIIKVLIIVS